MKHIYYTFISGFVCILALVFPLDLSAQCSTCPGGVPSMTIEHVVVLDTTTASTNTISFPKFPPATGTLVCATLYDTFSLVATSGARNRDPYAKVARFLLSLSPSITGPGGMNINDNVMRSYGPSNLDAFGTPGDTTTYGPDTVFNNVHHQQTVTGTGAYLGSGTIDFTFDISGGLLPQMGGMNYNLSVSGKLWGKFKLVYSYCPPSPLPEIFRQFTATKQPDHTIKLQWSVSNEEISNSYEIEISYDGRTFIPAGKVAGQYAAQGASAKYNYQFLPDKTASGKLYVRLKQLNTSGHGRYSAVRQVGLGTNTPVSFITYPNPVKDQVTIQADQPLKGRYRLDLVSGAGQTVFTHTLNVNNSSMLQLNIPPGITKGMYFLRSTALSDGNIQTFKVLINR